MHPDTDDAGTLDGFVQTGSARDDDELFEPIYALWIVEGMESGNYYGRSILDAALDPWADYAAIPRVPRPLPRTVRGAGRRRPRPVG